MRHVAIIPARSGSKGLPDKNIKPFCGKPMLAYSIEAALNSGIFDTVHVSTDSEEYGEIARKFGADVPFLRSKETASDTAGSWEVVLETLGRYQEKGKEFDTVTLLQPTSPLRTAQDIIEAHRILGEKKAGAVVAVCEMDHSPLWSNTLPEDHCMESFLSPQAYQPRQAISPYYRINGAVYLILVETLRRQGKLEYNSDTYAYVMPRQRSIDIDDQVDFLIAEAIMKQGV